MEMKELAVLLPQCPALSEMYLFENKIGDQGAGRLAEALLQCPALSSVDFSKTKLDLKEYRVSENNGEANNKIVHHGEANHKIVRSSTSSRTWS